MEDNNYELHLLILAGFRLAFLNRMMQRQSIIKYTAMHGYTEKSIATSHSKVKSLYDEVPKAVLTL